jgi:hypothetical protein
VRRTLLILLGVALIAGVPVYAHHSFARDYFEDQIVSIEGAFVQLQLINPHSIMTIAVRDERGQTQNFTAEWRGVTRLNQEKVTASTFQTGDYLILTGSPGRKPEERRIHLKGIHRPADGLRLGQSR